MTIKYFDSINNMNYKSWLNTNFASIPAPQASPSTNLSSAITYVRLGLRLRYYPLLSAITFILLGVILFRRV